MKIINTHSHCNTLKEISAPDVIEQLVDDDIVAVVPSSNPVDMFEVSEFIKQSDNLWGYVGVFPEEVKSFSDKTLSDMEGLIKSNPKIIGIGEVGLDYYWDRTYIELQKEVFIKQIEFANQMNLPLNIHCRDAHFDTLEILKKYNKNSTAILHCYSGSWEFAKECIKEGIYISIGGIVTFKNAKKIKEVAQKLPLEYLLLETDDPYLTPTPYRGKENRPIYVKYVAQEIASIRKISFEEICETTVKNTLNIFPQIKASI